MNDTKLPTIDLCLGTPPGILFPAPTGVLWTNQVGGHACLHPAVEGFFVPCRLPAGLESLMVNAGMMAPIAESEAWVLDTADALFEEGGLPLKVDRDQATRGVEEGLPDGSAEAWLWVEVLPHDSSVDSDGTQEGLLVGLVGRAGVLTWGNSD